jgi:predicted amidohydrolase
MKLAAAAYPIDWHNRWNDYVGKLRVWVRTAAEQGAELLLFPEHGALELASLAGEDNARDAERAIEAVSARIKDVDDLHASLAREFKVVICAASGPVRDGKRPYNRARLFAPEGARGHQDKLVLSDLEQAIGIAPGARPRVFETPLGRLGVLIGADAGRPAIGRAMAEAGAEILLAPSACESLRAYWRARAAAVARAVENRCAVAHAVAVGTADWLPVAVRTHGMPGIYVPPDPGLPEDGVIAEGKMDSAGWVHGEVAPEALREARAAARGAEPIAEVEIVPLGGGAG